MANQAAFVGDWLKTGDQGFFDDDGYLFLVGRSQEIINRDGEKVAPREVDQVLLEIEVSRFFETPTVAEMACHLEALKQVGQAARASSAIVRSPRVDGVLASIAQERLCKLQRVLPGMLFFNILYALRLTSLFDAAVLERSVNVTVRRHEILRMTFAVSTINTCRSLRRS
jgi:acyl-CoA synthetase (AMP-forming)/AMP-acid ligase II